LRQPKSWHLPPFCFEQDAQNLRALSFLGVAHCGAKD
jgi:hypothetical protein